MLHDFVATQGLEKLHRQRHPGAFCRHESRATKQHHAQGSVTL